MGQHLTLRMILIRDLLRSFEQLAEHLLCGLQLMFFPKEILFAETLKLS